MQQYNIKQIYTSMLLNMKELLLTHLNFYCMFGLIKKRRNIVVQAYGIGGFVSVPAGPVSGAGAPPTSFVGQLGQQYFDTSVSPPREYIYNGQTWESGGNAYATTSVAGIVQLSSNVTTDSTSTTLVPYAKAVYDYGQSLVLAGANIAQTVVTGITNLATDAQAVAGTATVPGVTALAVQPSNLSAVFAAPPAIGGTTPAAAVFTTVGGTAATFSGLIQGSASATITTGATALNLASDASTGAVNLGTGAGARTITIGNVTGATAVAVNTGTGSFTVTSTGAGDIVLNSADTVLIDSAGVLELNSSAGVISVGNDAVAQNINVGTGAAARVITVGNSSGATQVVLNAGTAGVTVGANAIAQPIVIGNQTGATQVTIDSGTGAINVGTAIAKTITIGNVTGATAVAVNVGTGNFVVNGAASSLYNIGAATTTGTIIIGGTAQTGIMTLGKSSGINIVEIGAGEGATTVNIARGATAAKVVNIADGAVANVITIGTVSGAASMALKVGTGNFTLEGATTSTYAISGTGVNTGTITIGGGTGAQTLNVMNSTGGKTVNIAAGAGANVVTVGSVTGASSLALKAGTGNFTLEGDVATTYAISGTGANTGTITIGGGTGAQTLNMMASTGVKTINLGTGAAANVITIGTVTGAASLSLLAGTGNFSLDGAATTNYTFGPTATSGTVNIGGTGANTGTATVFGGTGAQTINIANNTGIKTINIAGDSATSANVIKIGTGAGAQTVTVGSTNTTSTLTLNAGSGNINATGGHLAIATVAKTLLVNGGAVTDFIGTGVLTAGTQVIANTNIATGDVIIITRTAVNASTALGVFTYTISNGVSFTVTAMGVTTATILVGDVSSYAYFIVRPT